MTQSGILSPEVLQAFEAVPDHYVILAPDFTILTASDKLLETVSRTRQEVQGRNLFEAFPDNPDLPDSDSTQNLRAALEWTLQHKQPFQLPTQRYDIFVSESVGEFQERYWSIGTTPVLDSAGEVQYIIHKAQDITDQVQVQKREKQGREQLKKLSGEQALTKMELIAARAEAELERSKLHHLLMQSPAMICIFEGPEHVFTLVNPPYQQLVGDRPILGKPILEAMPELAGQVVIDMLDSVYKTGKTMHAHEMKVQLDHFNTGGIGHNYYNFVYQAIRNLEGEIYGIMVFAYEVSAQVEARRLVEFREQTLSTLNKQMKVANQNTQDAYSELSQTQIKLQELNQELEKRVAERTRELEQSKSAIEEQRNFLHTIFMNAPTPFVILEGEKQIFRLVNPSFQQIFPGRAMIGKPLLEALPELDVTPIPKILEQVYQTGINYEAREYPLMLARNEGGALEEILFTFTYQAHIDEQGVIDGVLVFASDVTEQVKARKAVEDTAKRLRMITDALPVLIGYLDKEEKYRFANKAYETWFPIKSDHLLGRPVREVVGDKAYAGVKQYIERALAGERLDFESRMPYREDFVKYIRTSYVPDIQEGEVLGFYTLVHDITEQELTRQKIEQREQEALALSQKLAATNEELTATNEQLMRTNVDLDNFIYAASHDLKAPIFNIERLLIILLESIPLPTQEEPELAQVLGMISDSIVRFKRTIEHLTDVTKLQKENSQEASEVDLEELIHDVQLDLLGPIEKSGAQLQVGFTDCPTIRFSEKNLRSVIYNLVSNAIKYADPKRKPVIRINCQTTENYAVLTVQDNGLGMDLAGQKKIFSMFVRLHDHVEGSGIGLYMVKKIIENADGRIEVESEIGKGSTFKVYLKR